LGPGRAEADGAEVGTVSTGWASSGADTRAAQAARRKRGFFMRGWKSGRRTGSVRRRKKRGDERNG
jgi:hypothetical protein